MLRLKDLFKIDFSSKGGGKLADKIFNKYNITREEREEVKNEIANGGGGGGDSIFSEAYIKFKTEYYKELAKDLAETGLEIVYIFDGKKGLVNGFAVNYSVEIIPYARFRFPVNLPGYILNNLEDLKNIYSDYVNFDEDIEEITADEFYNFLNN